MLIYFTSFHRSDPKWMSQALTSSKPVSLQMGSRGLLPCDLARDRSIAFVYWFKGISFSGNLIYFNNDGGKWQKGGAGYDTLQYDMNENLSLIINSTRVEDYDQFTCEIFFRGWREFAKSNQRICLQ